MPPGRSRRTSRGQPLLPAGAGQKGAYLCDTLLRLAEAGTYRPLWSAGVLEESERNLVEERGLSDDAVSHRIGEMRRAFPDAEVSGYDTLIEAMECGPKDRHVLAAAVRGRAEVLVTFNTRDFPLKSTRDYDITVVHPTASCLTSSTSTRASPSPPCVPRLRATPRRR